MDGVAVEEELVQVNKTEDEVETEKETKITEKNISTPLERFVLNYDVSRLIKKDVAAACGSCHMEMCSSGAVGVVDDANVEHCLEVGLR